jgi:hypothetical protein
VFYILHLNEIADTNPWGWHLELCIEYYRDYGEILVDIYCHDVHKNYGIVTCEPVRDLSSEIIDNNTILLSWTEPEEEFEVEGYRVFRNAQPLNEDLLTETTYLDENLPNGVYDYYVVTHYTNDCISAKSNHVEETIYIDPCDYEITLASEIVNRNSILLQWSHNAAPVLIEGYQVYKNQSLINNELLTETTYLDENLTNGTYQYFIVAYFTNDCDTIVSNTVEETIELGIDQLRITNYKIQVFPNPTTGELNVTCHSSLVTNIEVYDVYGRKLSSHHLIPTSSHYLINISHLQAGLYFVRITTEKGMVTKKVVKMQGK